jgi:hypothetical protein
MPFNVTNKPHKQTPFLDLVVLFRENEFSLLLNQTLPLEKSFAFFLKLFQSTLIAKHLKLD